MGEDISNEKIKEALKIAQLNSMLENLPDGLDTIVGKNGNKTKWWSATKIINC